MNFRTLNVFPGIFNQKKISKIEKLMHSCRPIPSQGLAQLAYPSGQHGLAAPCRGRGVGAVTARRTRVGWRARRQLYGVPMAVQFTRWAREDLGVALGKLAMAWAH
jgi:hypothetical protein